VSTALGPMLRSVRAGKGGVDATGSQAQGAHGGCPWNPVNPKTLLVTNDRALSYGDRYGAVLDSRTLGVVRAYPIICGTINSYGNSIALPGSLLEAWCRTNFVLTSSERWLLSAPLFRWDGPNSTPLFRPNSPKKPGVRHRSLGPSTPGSCSVG
jgi:hypothetical protein